MFSRICPSVLAIHIWFFFFFNEHLALIYQDFGPTFFIWGKDSRALMDYQIFHTKFRHLVQMKKFFDGLLLSDLLLVWSHFFPSEILGIWTGICNKRALDFVSLSAIGSHRFSVALGSFVHFCPGCVETFSSNSCVGKKLDKSYKHPLLFVKEHASVVSVTHRPELYYR